MSFIRGLEQRRFSHGESGLYVYPSELEKDGKSVQRIDFCDCAIDSEDFVEIMFRVLERAGKKINLKDINKVRKDLYLKPIKRIKSNNETSRAYWDGKYCKKKYGGWYK